MPDYLMQFLHTNHLSDERKAVAGPLIDFARFIDGVLTESPKKKSILTAALGVLTHLADAPLSGQLPEKVTDGGYKPEYVDELKKLIAEKSAEIAAHVDELKRLKKELSAKEQEINDLLNYQSVDKSFKPKQNEDLKNGK